MNKTITFCGEEYPAKFEVCPKCEGAGFHVNPAIDGNGLSTEDFEEQGEEFFENYMGGVYDVTCERCNGRRVISVLDRVRCTNEQLRIHDETKQDLIEMYAIEASERLRGA